MTIKNKRGFTIIELVVVIAVIAILSAVLIPTFAGLIDKAKKSAAFQTASAAYTDYLSTLDYTSPDLVTAAIVSVDDKYYFVGQDGRLDQSLYDSDKAALNKLSSDNQSRYVQLNCQNGSVNSTVVTVTTAHSTGK